MDITADTEGTENDLHHVTEQIIGGAIAVHRELGPGLLESAYQACLAFELYARGLRFEQQKPLPIIYKGIELDCAYRIDLLVEERIVVELKTVERFEPIHDAQMLSYLKHSGCQIGLLINFKVGLLKDGIRRLVNGFPELTPRPPRPMRYDSSGRNR